VTQVAKDWPTATVGDSFGAGSRNLTGSKAHPGVSLTDAVRFGNSTTPRTWASPQAHDAKSMGTNTPGHSPQLRHFTADLTNGLRDPESYSTTGSRPVSSEGAVVLNADWVERLQGFPAGWTRITTAATDLRRSATRSCRPSRKSSRGASRS